MRVAALLGVALLVPMVGVAQELRKPLPPIAPKDVSECEALRTKWGPVLQRLDQVHDQCFRKYLFRGDWLTAPGPCGGTFQTTDKVCLPAAQQEVQARCESDAQVTACYEAVQEYKAREREDERQRSEQEKAAKAAEQEQQERREQMRREAEQMQNAWAEQQRKRVEDTRRIVEEQQRAAAEAERRRQEESRRAVDGAIRDALSASQRAEAYKAMASSVSERRVELTAGEQHELDDLRRRAASDGLRPQYVSAQPAARVPSDAAQLTQAVAGLLGSHAEDLVKWGLNRVEVGERMVEGWELADGWAGKFDAAMDTWRYGRSAWAGEATYEENVDAVVAGTSVLADYALMNPAIAIQVGRAVGMTADIQKAALYQIQMMVSSTELTADEIAGLSDFRAIVHAQYGIFLDDKIWTGADDRFEPVGLPEHFGRTFVP